MLPSCDREELCAKILGDTVTGTPSLRKFKERGRLDVVAPKPGALSAKAVLERTCVTSE